MAFRDDFLWGAATASFQIEGAAYEDGKGLSIWDTFCKEPGHVLEGHTGDVACDHYHRYKEDIAIMKEIGIKGYRFSVSWPRLLPDGTGAVNQKGIDFYNKLIDGLLEAGITPFLTLFHWDYPQELWYRGGWMNPDSSDWFADYATLIGKSFGDRVKRYMPLNEPQCFVGRGHEAGMHAPGIKFKRFHLLRMVHNALLAHGKAVMALRATSPDCKVGTASVGTAYVPATTSKADIEAARKATFCLHPDNCVMSVGYWADPMVLGKYPEGTEEAFGWEMPKIGANDMKTIAQKLDFWGQNIYYALIVKAGGPKGFELVNPPVGHMKSGMGWSVCPEVMYYLPKFLHDRYKLPMYQTENGMSNLDVVSRDGKVHDPARIEFLNAYLYNYRLAAEDGVDLLGFFQWSLMDNFEWAKGYDDRFGIVYVDYKTQKRTLKDSAHWYAETIRQNGSSLAPGMPELAIK